MRIHVLSVVAWPMAMLAIAAGGCSRLPDSQYTLRADAEKLELPAKQKQQIADFLEYFHGTPARPLMAMPVTGGPPSAFPVTGGPPSAFPVTGGPAETTSTSGAASIAKVDKPGYEPLHLELGVQVYAKQCAACHGTTGDGKGVAGVHLNPPPRDYRNGVFKFTSTPRGSKPRREDLRRILKYGAKGTSMPAFRFLSEEDTEAVIDYVQVLSSRGELEINLIREATEELSEDDDFDPETVAEFVTDISKSWDAAEGEIVRPITVNPPRTPETVHDGAVAFVEMYCVKCHARDGRGSKTADVGQDIWGRTAYPANLAMGMLHGGRRPIDVYRRIYSGINGTPMPSSKDPNTAIGETPEQRSDRIWHLVHFVQQVIEGNEIPPDLQSAIDEAIARSSDAAKAASLDRRGGSSVPAAIRAAARPAGS